VGIDEENFLVIESRAGTKWWWLVHTNFGNRSAVWKLGRILLPAGGEVKRNGNAPMASNGSFGIGPQRAVRAREALCSDERGAELNAAGSSALMKRIDPSTSTFSVDGLMSFSSTFVLRKSGSASRPSS
jgi:hypothetical protein